MATLKLQKVGEDEVGSLEVSEFGFTDKHVAWKTPLGSQSVTMRLTDYSHVSFEYNVVESPKEADADPTSDNAG